MAECGECLHDEVCFLTHTKESPGCCYFADKNKYAEVVRCRDCKHRYTMANDKSFCRVNFPFGKKDDDFCSYGERKWNGENM